MTAATLTVPHRRGACPGLSAPMATGDGLLVRLMPLGTVALDAFAGLCKAAQQHGNGVIEVTSRGSIQIRGLSAASAPRFAAAIAALGIAADDGVPIVINPLAGLDPEEIIDAGALAADLRRALARGALAQRLSAKVSVALDGGGALGVDDVSADVRLRAEADRDNVVVRVNANDLGVVAIKDSTIAVMRLLEVLAQCGRQVRARDIAPSLFRNAIADLLVASAGPCEGGQERKIPIGAHPLRDGTQAYGIGLAFGHADASSLLTLVAAAATAGASGLRTTPGRTLMFIGLTHESSPSFSAAAEALGFIVRADDPRRHVIACAGAPICGSAQIASRALAPRIAEIAAPYLDGTFTIHISGCAKGCAHPAPAALTVVGTPAGCALIANGSARDAPFENVATNELLPAVAEIARKIRHGGGDG
jgi:precorrin-3B synthase